MLLLEFFFADWSDSRTFLLAPLLKGVCALFCRSPIARRARPWLLAFSCRLPKMSSKFHLRGKNPCMLVGLLGCNIAGMGSGSLLLSSLSKLAQRLSCRSRPTFANFEGRIFCQNFVHTGTSGVWAIFGLFEI